MCRGTARCCELDHAEYLEEFDPRFFLEKVAKSHEESITLLKAAEGATNSEETKQVLHYAAVTSFLSGLDKVYSIAVYYLYLAGKISKAELKPPKHRGAGVVTTRLGLPEKYTLLRSKDLLSPGLFGVNLTAFNDANSQVKHRVSLSASYLDQYQGDELPLEGYIQLFYVMCRWGHPNQMYQLETDRMLSVLRLTVEHLTSQFSEMDGFLVAMNKLLSKLRNLKERFEANEIRDYAKEAKAERDLELPYFNDVAHDLTIQYIGMDWEQLLKD